MEVHLTIQTLIKRSEYHDSVTLMLVARELSHMAEVEDAAVVMGTEANKGLLKNAGLLTPEAEAASPNDLVIAVKGEQAALGRYPGGSREAAPQATDRDRRRANFVPRP